MRRVIVVLLLLCWQAQAFAEELVVDSGASVGVALAVEGDLAVASGRYGEVYVFVRQDKAWSLRTRLNLDVQGGSLEHGASVAIAQRRIFVGVPDEFRPGPMQGTVYVFAPVGEEWLLEDKLVPSDTDNLSLFGLALSAHGDRLVVGAPTQPSDFYGPTAGAAYVFERVDDSWQEVAKLEGHGGEFGSSVSLSSERVLIGAPKFGKGYAAIFAVEDWNVFDELVGEDSSPGDRFGAAVAMDEELAIVGAPGRSQPGLTEDGALYVFGTQGLEWQQVAVLNPDEAEDHSFFGETIALRGDTLLAASTQLSLAVGAGALGTASASGAVLVYKKSAGQWTRHSTLLAPVANFGRAVALSEELALISAGSRELSDPERVLVCDFSAAAGESCQASAVLPTDEPIAESAKLAALSGVAGNRQGAAVALLEDTAVVVASGADLARIFRRRGDGWQQEAELELGSSPDAEKGALLALGDGVLALGGSRLRAYERREGLWGTMGVQGDTSGITDVAIDGDRMIVSGRGFASIFKRGQEWQREVTFSETSGSYGGYGRAVAIEGDTAIIASQSEAEGTSIYVYRRRSYEGRSERKGSFWEWRGRLLVDAEAAFDPAPSIAIDGKTIMVGSTRGLVHVFEEKAGIWSKVAPLENADASFGSSVVMRDGRALIGAKYSAAAGLVTGAAYLFVRRQGRWQQEQTLVASNRSGGDAFGASLALDRSGALVGAPNNDEGGAVAGSAYFYDLPAESGGCGCSAGGDPLSATPMLVLLCLLMMRGRQPERGVGRASERVRFGLLGRLARWQLIRPLRAALGLENADASLV